jgi:hypothetical protein
LRLGVRLAAAWVLLQAARPASAGPGPSPAPAEPTQHRRSGLVRVVGHSLQDRDGPFLGLGVSYFTALWRFRNDRPRLESDLAFLSRQGFNYYRMLSMVGWNSAWKGLEIAPVPFSTRDGRRIAAWPDYWAQLAGLVDLAYDRYGMRTQITVFADAQLMPRKQDRIEHLRRLLADVVAGREQKIMLIEVANEAWQNGFPGQPGVADLREFTRYLADRTPVPVATTSNHEGSFRDLYGGSAADIATWHFSRDRSVDDGWKPVYDCWDLGDAPGCPPVSSNEPIGPGASVASQTDAVRLVMAAVFAYVARLPMYVFHCEAGVMGRTRFEDTPGIRLYRPIVSRLPADLPNWERTDARESRSLFTIYAGGAPNTTWPEAPASSDGCVRMVGARKGSRFVYAAIGIRPGGLTIRARAPVSFRMLDALTGQPTREVRLRAGERRTLDAGPGARILVGRIAP